MKNVIVAVVLGALLSSCKTFNSSIEEKAYSAGRLTVITYAGLKNSFTEKENEIIEKVYNFVINSNPETLLLDLLIQSKQHLSDKEFFLATVLINETYQNLHPLVKEKAEKEVLIMFKEGMKDAVSLYF